MNRKKKQMRKNKEWKTRTCSDAETSLADSLQRGGGKVDAILQDTNHPYIAVVCAQLALVVGPGRAQNVPMGGVQL